MEVAQLKKKGGEAEGMVKGALPMIGQAIGTAYGGPAGGMAGGMIGSQLAGGIGGAGQQTISSPVDRRMDQLKSDPTNILKEGKAALDGLDSQTRQNLSPVLDEAIKKATLEKMKGQSSPLPQQGMLA